jgi:hypothetical protein
MAAKASGSWLDRLIWGEPQPRKLSKKQRRLIRRLQQEHRQREGFLDYLLWLTSQKEEVR